MSPSLFEIVLKSINAHPLVDPSISSNNYIPIDLSIHNSILQNINSSSSKDLDIYIWNHIKAHNAKIAYGGYLEKRNIYKRSNYFNNNLNTERNIHIGLDLWIEAGTVIYAPFNGQVHSFKNNTNYGDYGPTLVLRHQIKKITFYTLYGHLSLNSLKDKKVGLKILKGQRIATLGTTEVNGDYPPHLHFQIIKDIQNYFGDYPGVCNTMHLKYYKKNCPNPNLVLHL